MKPLPFDKPCACGCGGMATVRYVRGHAPKSPSFIAQTERTDPVPRFWAKVDKSGKCWLWTGSTNRRGYGSFRVHHGIPSLAHRYAYELEIGPVPDGKFVCHSCDTPACVNPAHLWVGTHSDNMRDMHAKGRGRAAPRWSALRRARYAARRAGATP